MTTVNGDAAIAWMRAKGTNVPGTCLNTCWQAYGSHSSIGAHAGQYPDAIDGWRFATKRHPGDPTPPAGYPVYFDALSRPRYGGDTNYASGDIVISLGGGNVICTDGAGSGRIGIMTISQRARQIGRTYLGWTEDFLGYDVVTVSAAALSSTPITTPETEDIDMPTSIVMQEPNKTLWLLPEDGSMTALHSTDELAALIMTDAIKIVRPDAVGNDRYWIPAAQQTINLRKQIATRKGALKS